MYTSGHGVFCRSKSNWHIMHMSAVWARVYTRPTRNSSLECSPKSMPQERFKCSNSTFLKHFFESMICVTISCLFIRNYKHCRYYSHAFCIIYYPVPVYLKDWSVYKSNCLAYFCMLQDSRSIDAYTDTSTGFRICIIHVLLHACCESIQSTVSH